MAQNENYSQVDLRVGTEEQFNAKVGTLPAGALFGVTDSTVSKADLSTDLKNEINGKINKPASPTTESAITINSSGTVSTKPLTSIIGKSEVYVGSTTPTNEDEILWINPDGTSGGGSGSGKLYKNSIFIVTPDTGGNIRIDYLDTQPLIGIDYEEKDIDEIVNLLGGYAQVPSKAVISTNRSGPPPTSMGSTASSAYGILTYIYSDRVASKGFLNVSALVTDGEKVGTQDFTLSGVVTAKYTSEEI